ncbi:MAG: signal recognition particle-docking protein FtsY [Methylococcales bacterium]|nr:signal recognition particle-docking protein FtsY [Methylococcales bacterium]
MFRKTTLFSLVIALAIIVLASYVRLTNIGSGCLDWAGWPGCYANTISLSGQVTGLENTVEVKDSIKQNSYLYFVGLLGVLVFFLTITAWKQKQGRVATIALFGVLLFFVSSQMALGLWTVKLKVMPLIITGHLLIGFVAFWILFLLYLRANPINRVVQQSTTFGLKSLTQIVMIILLFQTVIGFWVSSNQAGLVCAGFPQCNNAWVPKADYLGALNLFSGFSNGYTGVLSFDGQVAVHWLHRVGALVCFLLLTLVMLFATSENNPKHVRRSGVVLSILLLVQILLGVYSVKLELPLWVTIFHNIFAALLMLPLITISYYKKYSFEDFSYEIDDDTIFVDEITVETIEPSLDTEVVEEPYIEPTQESLYLRLKTQLKKTRTGLGGVFSSISLGQKEINSDLLEEIESSLLMADVGVEATTEIISRLTASIERNQLNDGKALESKLKEMLLEMLEPCNQTLEIPKLNTPFVILVVGINGVGKTTTIGKLAKRLQVQGHSVMLAAGDTFRAAAVEQLETWGERNNVHVVAQHTGADSASVIYDGVQSAKAKGIDVLIADTAGRLHTKSNLMEELSKIKRIMGKVDDSAPHEVLLVLDAGTGQNALSQTKIFNESVKLSGLALTKLDGTAKGGVIFALAKQFELPIRFIGVGEGIDDLQDFNAEAFVDALFVKD